MKHITLTSCGLPDALPRVGVIILATSDAALLRVLDSLEAQTFPEREVFVVDCSPNGEAGRAALVTFPDIFLFDAVASDLACDACNIGLNAALKHGGFDYFWLLFDRVCPQRGALELLLETCVARPDVAMAGSWISPMEMVSGEPNIGAYACGSHSFHTSDSDGNSLGVSGATTTGSGTTCFDRNHFGMTDAGGDVDLFHGRFVSITKVACNRIPHGWYDVDFLSHGSCLMRSVVVREVGMMTRLPMIGAMMDWCLRIRRLGHGILMCAASRVEACATDATTSHQTYDMVRSMLTCQSVHAFFLKWAFLETLTLRWCDACAAMRCGREADARQILIACQDFLCDTVREVLPSTAVAADAAVSPALRGMVEQKPARVWVVGDAARAVLDEASRRSLCASGAAVSLFLPQARGVYDDDASHARPSHGITHDMEHEIMRDKVNLDGTEQVRDATFWKTLPLHPLLRDATLIWHRLRHGKPDYVIVAEGEACASLVELGRQVLLVRNKKCVLVRGGWARVWGCFSLLRYLPGMVCAFLRFCIRK